MSLLDRAISPELAVAVRADKWTGWTWENPEQLKWTPTHWTTYSKPERREDIE